MPVTVPVQVVAPISDNTLAPVLKSTLPSLSNTKNLSVSVPAFTTEVSCKDEPVILPLALISPCKYVLVISLCPITTVLDPLPTAQQPITIELESLEFNVPALYPTKVLPPPVVKVPTPVQ